MDAIVADAVIDDCRIPVAHSLASVVAFEYVRQYARRDMDLAMTLGSPLALSMIRHRVCDAEHPPTRLGAWVDLRDPVAAAGPIGDERRVR